MRVGAAFGSVIWIFVVFMMATPATARAQSEPTFWRTVREPRVAQAYEMLEQARTILEQVERASGLMDSVVLIETAIRCLQTAHEWAPGDLEIRFELAQARSRHPDHTPAIRDVIRGHLEAIRAHDAMFRPADVAFQLAISFTKTHDFESAMNEYRRAIHQRVMPSDAIAAYGNLAEVTMLAGDLEGAVAHYRYTLRLIHGSPWPQPDSLALTHFGLAVALDRLGEAREALDEVDAAIMHPRGLELLHDHNVFYEPEFEIHYYQALGFLARARSASSETERAEFREEARASFEIYQRLSQGQTQWTDVVEAHLEDLRSALGAR